jgi:hypothetical protein
MVTPAPNPVTLGDIVNAIAALTDPLDGSVDETGLTVRLADDRVVRIAFLTAPNRYDVDQLNAFSAAAAEYDARRAES